MSEHEDTAPSQAPAVVDLRTKRVEKLADEGFALLANKSYRAALDVARRLRREQWPGAADIAAQAFAGMKNLPKAIAVLEHELRHAPDCWPLWELLGNYRSDSEDFSGANAAYESALACPSVNVDAIRLNQAIVAERTGNADLGLSLIELIEDPSQYLAKVGRKGELLLLANRASEALALCAAVACPENPTPEDRARLARICRTQAKAHLALGDPVDRVQERLLRAIRTYPESAELLWMLRELQNACSTEASVFNVVMYYKIDPQRREDEATGFSRFGRVVADSPSEAISYLRAIEESQILALDGEPKVERMNEASPSLKGVFVLFPVDYYSE